MSTGKKYQEAVKRLDHLKKHTPDDALNLIKEKAFAKFDETVEAHFNLGIDSRHADQQLRGTLKLPHGTGRSVRVVVICKDDKAAEAKHAGAEEAGGDALVEKIQSGWLDFDVLISTPDMMGKLAKLGKVLGPKGLMPNPKSGTVVTDIEKAVVGFKAGMIEYRNDKHNNLHLPIGKLSFSLDKLLENFASVFDAVIKAKPAKAKGVYLRSITLASTMGPGIKLDPNLARKAKVNE